MLHLFSNVRTGDCDVYRNYGFSTYSFEILRIDGELVSRYAIVVAMAAAVSFAPEEDSCVCSVYRIKRTASNKFTDATEEKCVFSSAVGLLFIQSSKRGEIKERQNKGKKNRRSLAMSVNENT